MLLDTAIFSNFFWRPLMYGLLRIKSKCRCHIQYKLFRSKIKSKNKCFKLYFTERPYPKYLVCDGIFVDCTVSKELEYGKSEVVKLAKGKNLISNEINTNITCPFLSR